MHTKAPGTYAGDLLLRHYHHMNAAVLHCLKKVAAILAPVLTTTSWLKPGQYPLVCAVNQLASVRCAELMSS